MQKRTTKHIQRTKESKERKASIRKMAQPIIMAAKIHEYIRMYKLTGDHTFMYKAIDIVSEGLAMDIKTLSQRAKEVTVSVEKVNEGLENALVDVMGTEEFIKADAMACHMCGSLVDPESVCDRCGEFVCFECQKHGDAMTCIEEIRCQACHENIMCNVHE